MSEIDEVSTPGECTDEFPTFELAGAVDDAEDPTRLTVFPESREDITTTWITVPIDHSVDIRDSL